MSCAIPGETGCVLHEALFSSRLGGSTEIILCLLDEAKNADPLLIIDRLLNGILQFFFSILLVFYYSLPYHVVNIVMIFIRRP